MTKVRRAARRIRAVQSAAGVHLPVHAVLCVQGPPIVPRDRAGVRVIPRLPLVREITERNRAALPHLAERAATSLRKAAG
jgi:hypothetical protein